VPSGSKTQDSSSLLPTLGNGGKRRASLGPGIEDRIPDRRLVGVQGAEYDPTVVKDA
jgi:hypothetical protein